MKFLLRLPLYCLFAVILLCVLTVYFGVGDHADIQLGWSLNRDDIARAKKILHEGSKTRPDEIGTLQLNKEDLNLAANYLLNRYSNSAVVISLKKNQLKFSATITLPANKLGKYLNVTIAFGNVDGEQLPVITKFKAGKLLLPSKMAAMVIDFGIRHSFLNEYFILATRPIKAVAIDPEKITITYFTSMETLLQAKQFLAHSEDNPMMGIYQEKISEVIAQHDPKWRLSLATLLKAVFALAQQRSNQQTAITENRMAILAVNDYVNKHAVPRAINNSLIKNRYYPAYLYKRFDLAQHFIGSASLAASIDGQVANVLGEEKELNDALKGGSGFSFIDLTADKAGTRFGEYAIASPEQAQQLQKAMAVVQDYHDFMPDPTDLPEHMNEEAFKQRYQSTQSDVYLQALKQIDEKIAGMAIYRQQASASP